MAKKSYEVVTRVTHDGKDYEVGKPITLEDDAAAPLLAVNAIAETTSKSDKKTTDEK